MSHKLNICNSWWILLLLQCFLLSQNSFAQQVDSASVHLRWYQRTAVSTFAAPAVFIGYGLSCQGNHGLYSSIQARRDVRHTFGDFRTPVDNYLVYVPTLGIFAADVLHTHPKHSFQNQVVLYAFSLGLTEIAVQGLKRTTNELRPDGSDYLSFPSSHTAVAFVGAECLHQEFKNESIWYSVAGYGVATATGALRMINDKHWLNDVCIGAGTAILVTRLTYMAYPWFISHVWRRHSQGAWD